MGDHIWRVPIIPGVIACSALLQFAAGVVASMMLRRRSSSVVRFVTALTLGALAVASGIVLNAAVTSLARRLEISVVHVDPGPLAYVAPSLFALFAWVAGHRLLRGSWWSKRALLFYAWLIVFTAMNTINFCSPGWCMTMGFPIPWHSWSDAIFESAESSIRVLETVGDIVLEIVGAAVDLMTFVIIAWAITRSRPGGP